MLEESNVKVLDPVKRAEVVFEFEGDETLLEMHVFSATKFEGEVKERCVTAEAPQWGPLPGYARVCWHLTRASSRWTQA